MKKYLFLFAFLLLFLLIASPAWGACTGGVCYVRATGSTPTAPYDTWEKGSATITAAQTQAANGDIIEIAAGTYTLINISKQITLLTTSNPTYTGTVTITHGLADHTIRVTNTGITVSGLLAYPMQITQTYTSTGRNAIYSNGAYSATFNYVQVSSANDHAVTLLAGATGVFNYFKLTGNTVVNKTAIYINASTVTCNYGIIRGGNTASIAGSGASGTSTFNNVIVSDGLLRAVYIDNAGHAIVFNNSIISGEVFSSSYPVIHRIAGSVTLNNCMVFHRFDTPRENGYSASGVTLNSSLENNYPYFTSYRRDGAIVLSLDDSGYADNAAAVKTVLDGLGVHFTWDINTLNMNAARWIQAKAHVQAGHDIGMHQYSNTMLSYANAIRVTVASGGASPTCTFDGTTITLASTGRTPITIDTSTAAKDKIGEICTTYSDGGGGTWTLAKSTTGGQTAASISDSAKATSLAIIGATAVPMDILFNRSAWNVGLFNDEIVDPKAEIETQIQTIGGAYAAWTCGTMGHAMSGYDATSKAAARSAGLKNNRGSDSTNNSSILLYDIDMFASPLVLVLAAIGTTVDQVQSSVRNMAFQIKENGAVLSLVMHNESGWSVSGDTALLSAFITELQKYGVRIYSHREYSDWIAGGDWADDGDGTWSRTWTDASNYYLQAGSPAIDTGTDVSLATDYTGNNIYGTPDIGGYEYQPPYTFAANNIPTTGSARLYSDGKYMMLTATSSNATGTFSVMPASGSYLASTTQYMDISIDSWLTSGTKNKQWTASSTEGAFQTQATSTLYTIGDLAVSKYYQFKLDGAASSTAIIGYGSTSCTNGICLSDSSGQIQFTYSGGYSTHIFALVQNTDAPTNVGISSITPNSTSQLTILAKTAADADPGLHATPYYFEETTGHDGGSSSSWQNSTTFIDTGLSANTQYTYQVKAKDANSNESVYSDTLSKYTLAPTPTNLVGTAGQATMSLSVDSFTNSTVGSSGYYFSRSGANSGWLQTNSWSDSGLICGTSYTYSVIYHNGDGTETNSTSLAKSTNSCPGEGGGAISNAGAMTAPVIPPQTSPASSNADIIALQTQLDGLLATLQVLQEQVRQQGSSLSQNQISGIPPDYKFNVSLQYRDAGNPVAYLQKFLKSQGFNVYPEGIVSGWFGLLTYKAVIRFQEKYAQDILAPWKLTKGTGFVGKTTRAKINELMGF